MRAVVQRVLAAAVVVDGEVVGRIGPGLLVYAAAAPDDAGADVEYIAEKVAGLRIFPDAGGKMNLSVGDIARTADPAQRGARDAAIRALVDEPDPPTGAIPPETATGGVLLVSAFTVLADARKGRRPSFDGSAPGPIAEPLVSQLAAAIRSRGLPVETGRFAAYMQVESVNDGPICILLDSRRVL